MKYTLMGFLLIGLWSGILLVQEEAFEYECDILQRLDYLETKYTETQQMLNSANELITAQDSRIAAQNSKIVALESLTKLQGQSVGFTMSVPIASPTTRQLTFGTTVSNVGGGYNVTTGVFTCSIPGYYYFSASLLKVWSYESSAYCTIRTNNVGLVRTYTDPGHTPKTGNYASVNSVFVHQDAGDNVTLADCTAISSFAAASSFSGFLVTADVI